MFKQCNEIRRACSLKNYKQLKAIRSKQSLKTKKTKQ